MLKIIIFLFILFSTTLYKTEASQYCGYGQIYDFATDSCKCSYGFRENNGMCVSNDQYCKNKYGIMSKSDINGNCTCAYGYRFKGNQCVPLDTYCKDIFGSASYYSPSGECECQSGYILDQGKCTSAILYCTNNFGIQATYNYASKECECSAGNTFNERGNKCISLDDRCKEDFGPNSYAPIQAHVGNLPVSCNCQNGFIWNENQTKCIDANYMCQSKIGRNSTYNFQSNYCECNGGYVLDQNSCISEEDFCSNNYGENYEYSGGNQCTCIEGFTEEGGECKKMTNFWNTSLDNNFKTKRNISSIDLNFFINLIKILSIIGVIIVILAVISYKYNKNSQKEKRIFRTKK